MASTENTDDGNLDSKVFDTEADSYELSRHVYLSEDLLSVDSETQREADSHTKLHNALSISAALSGSHTKIHDALSISAAMSESHTKTDDALSISAAMSESHTKTDDALSISAAMSESHTKIHDALSISAAMSDSHTKIHDALSISAAMSGSHTNIHNALSISAAMSDSHTKTDDALSISAAMSESHTKIHDALSISAAMSESHTKIHDALSISAAMSDSHTKIHDALSISAAITYSTDTFEADDTNHLLSHTLPSVEYSDTFEDTDHCVSSQPQGEVFDEVALARRDFLTKLTERLRTGTDHEIKATPNQPIGHGHTSSRRIHRDEAAFCCQLIDRLKKRGATVEIPDVEPPQSPPVPLSCYGIHPQLMERARLKRIMSQMKQAAECEIHDPRECPDCRKHNEKLRETETRVAFMRDKTAVFRNRATEDRLATHLATMDSVTLIAELARSLPRASTDARTIERQLLAPIHARTDRRRDTHTGADDPT